jgi:hypothetical protein
VTDTIRGVDMGLERRLRYCREGRLPYSYCDDYLGYGSGPYSYSPYGYSPYGLSPYGFGGDPFGVGAGFGYYGRRPPVIVVTPPGTPSAEGRAVKGKGYTRRGGSSSGDGGTAEPRSQRGTSSTSSDRSTTRSRGESSGSSGKSSERSGGSRETGRTAKPRNP